MGMLSKAKKGKQQTHPAVMQTEIADDAIDALETDMVGDGISKEILVIAQEVKIVQSLACNDVSKRNRQMRKLRKWLQLRSRSSFTFTEEDFRRIWKGLYYNYWMSDKPLVQEELAEQMGKLLECFEGKIEFSIIFFGAFMRTMCQEWFGIDQWRIDKFLMLVRRMLRNMFRVLRGNGWTEASLKSFNDNMQQTVLTEETAAKGLIIHYLDIFCEELAKVSDGKISEDQVSTLVRPFVVFIATHPDLKMVYHCQTNVLYHLLYQSQLGREYTEKYNAWEKMGFPTASIHDLEKDDSEPVIEEDVSEAPANEKHLDPRAGNIDVFMPEIPLNAKDIIEVLEFFIYKSELCTKRRKILKRVLNVFQQYDQGTFPLGVKKMPRIQLKSKHPLIKEKIAQLDNLENEMYGTTRKLKQLNKRKRRKLLKTLNFEEADESNFEQIISKAIPKHTLMDHRKRAVEAMMSGWVEEELEDEEISAKKSKLSVSDEKMTQINGGSVINDNFKSVGIVKKANSTKKQIAKKKSKGEDYAQENSNTVRGSSKKKFKLANASERIKNPNLVINESVGLTNSASKNVINGKSSEWETPLAEANQLTIATAAPMPVPHENVKPFFNSFAVPKTPKTPARVKRVKIVLKHNTVQKPSEYIKQLKSSPNLPFDAEKKPIKGVLKPNLLPGPINPFYRKRVGLRFWNNSF